jgi:hypothetical protein
MMLAPRLSLVSALALSGALLVSAGCGDDPGGGSALPAALVQADAPPANVHVNNPAADTGGGSHYQSETSLAVNETTGTICSTYNDSYTGVGAAGIGFSNSVNGGASFVDRGMLTQVPLVATSVSDPSVVWRRKDGNFYAAAVTFLAEGTGIGLWRSTDDCKTFKFLAAIVRRTGDKSLIAVDNNAGSPHFGRLYAGFTDFNQPQQIRSSFSDDGTTWSPSVGLNAPPFDAEGAWPVVAPNGTLFVAWWQFVDGDHFDIDLASSSDGGATFGPIRQAVAGALRSRDDAASAACGGRDALKGGIRFQSFPQVAIDASNCLHLTYTSAPDTSHSGDVADIYYRKSCDGVTWSTPVQINDDGTATDQFMSTISAGNGSVVSIGFYDRRNDPASNLSFDFYDRISTDGGNSFLPSQRVTSVTSPLFIDPTASPCYHGDYDQQVQVPGAVYLDWADDRDVQDGHHDPDVFFAALPAGATSTLTPVADAYVRDGSSAGRNFGGDPTLQVKNSSSAGNNRRAFLRFDLSGVTGAVTSATLRLFGKSGGGTSNESAFAVTDDSWTETGITYANQPPRGPRQGGSVPIGPTAQYYRFDVTSFVAARKRAGANVVSLTVAMDNPTSKSPDSFNSRDSNTSKPQLVVIAVPSGSGNTP